MPVPIEELAEQAAPAYQQAEPILLKVPCLRVVDAAGSESWMYDSREIIGYLEQRFTEAA